jgi:hypothetical protein
MFKRLVIKALLVGFFLWGPLGLMGRPAPALAGEMVVAGFLEKVSIDKAGLIFKAKLDTGARHSSLNADDIRVFKRKGARWVSFKVTDSTGKTLLLEKEAVRVAEVKLRNETFQARPVVLLPICIGPIEKIVEVNLVDRSFFNYQVLVGRSFLAGTVLVDAGAKYLHNPKACREGDAP